MENEERTEGTIPEEVNTAGESETSAPLEDLPANISAEEGRTMAEDVWEETNEFLDLPDIPEDASPLDGLTPLTDELQSNGPTIINVTTMEGPASYRRLYDGPSDVEIEAQIKRAEEAMKSTKKKPVVKKKKPALSKEQEWIKEKVLEFSEKPDDIKGVDLMFAPVNKTGLHRVYGTSRFNLSALSSSMSAATKWKGVHKVYSLAKKVFEEAFYDFDIHLLKSDQSFWIIFKYPEVEVTNSIPDVHHIYDMYVTGIFHFDNARLSFNELQGQRTKFTTAEHQSKYVHSHLRSEMYYPQTFCLGDDTALQNFKHRQLYFNEEDQAIKDYFFEYMMNVEQYICWESQEGGPYTYIDRVELNLKVGDIVEANSIKKETVVERITDILMRNPACLKLYKKGNFIQYHLNKDRLKMLFDASVGQNTIHHGEYLYHMEDNTKEFIDIAEDRLIDKTTKKAISFDYKENRNAEVIIIASDEKHRKKFKSSPTYNFAYVEHQIHNYIIQNI